MPKRLSCLSPQSFRHSFNWCGFKLFLWPMVSIELFNTCSLVIRTTPSIAALIQLMWFQNDLAAIPIVLVGVTSFIPTRQQHSSRRQQQANSRQAPEAIRFLAVVGEETTSKRRMKRRWNQTLATPGPEWAAPIPAAPAELSSRKINPWAKERQAPNQLDTTGVPNGTAGSKQQQCKSLSRRW